MMPNVHPLERWASVAGGAVLAFSGLRRGVGGIPRVFAGAALLHRGLSGHCEAYRMLGVRTAPSDATIPYKAGVRARAAITIDAPRDEIFFFWRQLENLPLFMKHIVDVTMGEDGRSHWVAEGIAGSKLRWTAEIINEIQDELIAWKSLPGGDVDSAGSVRFQDAPGGRGTEVHESESFALGTARLQQVFLKSSPPKEIEPLRRYVRTLLLTKMIAEDWPKADVMLGSSGTIRALTRLIHKGKKAVGKGIERGELRKLIKAMSTMTTTQLLGLPGMEAKRVDMILAGAILLEECMDAVGAKKVMPTEFSLRDGILEEQLQLVRQQKTTRMDFRLPNLYTKAIQFGCEPKHVDQTVALAEQLFIKLRPLHKLGLEWKPYLIAAAILHDVGEAVTPTAHEVHSYYIVKNADFPAMEPWESEFVAQLCLRHRGGKVERKVLPFDDKMRQTAFLKLLALLRVADALDRGHTGALTIRGIRVDRKAVRLSVQGRGPIDLELLRIEQKKDLFEEIFGRELITLRA